MIDQAVADALDALPPLDNCTVIIEDEHPTRNIYGLWERHRWGGCTITLYEHPILRDGMDPAVVLRHEVGHHLGMTEEQLHAAALT